ncbi:OadG family protein [Cetobacterium sp. 2A]|uniref:OadG family protein n=1 Tax=unclassified Cetobacterium TaxID=2630983 RepID=UPI00163CE3F8|nr:OadG family protein [Cetobacterium sp. 2A]MBC2857375.1 OadG family protein [Cetobacterium sp. 2A]
MNSNIFGGDGMISLNSSLYITFVSMVIVFFVLILISAILSLFKYIPAEKVEIKKSGTNAPTPAPVAVAEKSFNPEDIKDEKMLVAMMVASIEAASDDENAYIRVKSIKELN